MKKILLIVSLSFLLASCGGGAPTNPTSPEANSSNHVSTNHLIMKAHTPNPGDTGDFFIRGDIESGEVNVGDTVDIAEKGGRSISIKVKSISDSAGDYQKASKGQLVSIYFDGDKSLYDTVSMDAYLVEKGGKYPTLDTPTPNIQTSNLVLKGKLNGQEWEGKSMINPPPYYKYGSRAMMSPDMPIFLMSFLRSSDNSSINFDLKGELKVGKYTKDTLNINYSDNNGTNVYDKTSDVYVEITSYVENGNTAMISGKISGTIQGSRGSSTIEAEWKDAKIDVWGVEAK